MLNDQSKVRSRPAPYTVVAFLWFALTPTLAAAQAGRGSGAVEAVLACRTVEDKASQLACFRVASDRLAAEQAAEPTTPPPPPSGPPRVFGVRPARPPRAARPPEVRQVSVKLRGLSDPGDGRIVFDFDDGSTWREIDPDSVAGGLRLGEAVTLEKGLLGSYFLNIPGRASVKITRLRGG
jgi:hypothetical protein